MERPCALCKDGQAKYGYYAGNMDPGLKCTHRKWIVIAGSSKDYHCNNTYMLLHKDIDRKRLIIRRTTAGFVKEDIS